MNIMLHHALHKKDENQIESVEKYRKRCILYKHTTQHPYYAPHALHCIETYTHTHLLNWNRIMNSILSYLMRLVFK